MRLSRHLLVAALGASAPLVAACDAVPEPATPPAFERPLAAPSAPELPLAADLVTPPTAADLDVFVPDPAILHAFRHPAPGLVGKSVHSDRMAALENYAVTAPPANIATIRPMTEWEPMRAISLAFPADFLNDENATATVVEIVRASHPAGEVWVAVNTAGAESGLKRRLKAAGVDEALFGSRIRFHRMAFESIWLIDFSPLPLIDSVTNTFAFADFRYYFDRPLDDGIPTALGRDLATGFGAEGPATTYRMPLDTEGGTFQASSDGVCFTSSRQLFNMSCLDRAGRGCDESILRLDLTAMQQQKYAVAMRETLAAYTGCKDLVITHSVTDDGTGHLDMYFKLLDDARILLGEYRAPFANQFQRQNADLLDENAAFLESYVRPNGEGYTVERLVMPGHRTMQGLGQVPFTFINSTFFNGVNLWPMSDHAPWAAAREEAQATWERVLPDMTHVAIDATNLSFYSGAIHCITRTIPDLPPGLWIADGTCTGGSCVAPEGGREGACEGEGTSTCFGPAWLCSCNDCENDGCADPCEGVGYEGCCDAGDVVSCENGQLVKYDCQNTGCGWNGRGGYYDCDTAGAEPSGTFPITCGGCEPACDGRTCGDDGCGGSCGACADGVGCVAGTCREDCSDCTPGEIGCDGTVAWLCNEPEAGCKTTTRIDCADRGLTCAAGDCVPGEPGPDATPEADADADAAPAEVDAATGGGAEVDGVTRTGGAGGCASGGATGLLLGLSGLLAAASARRRA